jgi:hypothetical protein
MVHSRPMLTNEETLNPANALSCALRPAAIERMPGGSSAESAGRILAGSRKHPMTIPNLRPSLRASAVWFL